MSTEGRPGMREIVLFVPAGSRATAKIPRGSAIVGEPRCGAGEVEIYFESAAPQRRGMRTLADRALSASGRMLECAVFGGCLLVPPSALTVVGTINFAEGGPLRPAVRARCRRMARLPAARSRRAAGIGNPALWP